MTASHSENAESGEGTQDEASAARPTGSVKDHTKVSASQPTVLDNGTCPYCAAVFGDECPGTKEHVVGRRFVPKGKMAEAWNLIFQACEKCNGLKADLENDISVISMHVDPTGIEPADAALMRAEIDRRATKTLSRNTRKPVSEGEKPLVLKGAFGPATMTFTLNMPPQVTEKRLFDLACFQMLGFFYFLTYRPLDRRGNWWGDGFHPLLAVRRSDWGNPVIRWFEEITKHRREILHVQTAAGFYKAWIREMNDKPNLWAWAIEWNQGLRLVGFFGDEAEAITLGQSRPTIKTKTIHNDGKRIIRMRAETAVETSDDHLFDMIND